MSSRVFLGAAILLAALVALAWWLVPAPTSLRTTATEDAAWVIPAQPVSKTGEALAALNKVSLWGKLAETVQLTEIEPAWRFVGAVVRGQERQVVIKKDNQPEQMLSVGDALPGGSKILAIETDRICVLVNGLKRNLYLYPQGRLSEKMSATPIEAGRR